MFGRRGHKRNLQDRHTQYEPVISTTATSSTTVTCEAKALFDNKALLDNSTNQQIVAQSAECTEGSKRKNLQVVNQENSFEPDQLTTEKASQLLSKKEAENQRGQVKENDIKFIERAQTQEISSVIPGSSAERQQSVKYLGILEQDMKQVYILPENNSESSNLKAYEREQENLLEKPNQETMELSSINEPAMKNGGKTTNSLNNSDQKHKKPKRSDNTLLEAPLNSKGSTKKGQKSAIQEVKKHVSFPGDDLNRAKVLSDDEELSVASEVSSEGPPSRLRLRRTVAIALAWTAMGMMTEMIGPNREYLRSRLNITYNDIAYALTSRSAGVFLGSALGGVLSEMIPYTTDLWIAISLILASIGIAATPWCDGLVCLNLSQGLSGVARGTLTVASLSVQARLWSSKKYSDVTFILFFFYAIGACIAPQLTHVFETGLLQTLLGINSSASLTSNTSWSLFVANDNIYPFDIIAVFSFVIGASFLVFFGISLSTLLTRDTNASKESKVARVQNLKPDSWFVRHDLIYRYLFFFILAFLVLPTVTETVYGRWLTLLLDNATTTRVNRATCLLVQTTYWASVALGRLIVPMARRFLSSNEVILACTTTTLIASVLLSVYLQKYIIFIWIFVSILGTFSGVFIPAGFGFCNIYVSNSSMGIALLACLLSLGECLSVWQCGYLFQHFYPATLPYLSAAATTLVFICYLPMIPSFSKAKPVQD